MNQPTPGQIAELLRGSSTAPKVHFVGIGGCGMSGLAHLLLDLGCVVTGSDLVENAETAQLCERGVTFQAGHATALLQSARPTLVVYTPAIRRDNPELAAAERLGLSICRRATLLAALMSWQRGVCVAGMHGKTTTSALLAFALDQLGADPSYAIGAAVPQLPRHARLSGVRSGNTAPVAQPTGPGLATPSAQSFPNTEQVEPAGFSLPDAGRLFAAETDESDGTLPLFKPEQTVVLNVDEDHLDYYANLEAVCADFQRLAEQTTGELVYCADDANLARMFAGRERSVSYGFNPAANYRIEWLRTGSSLGMPPASHFELWTGQIRLGIFSTRLCGEKNISNAAGVAALLHRLGHEPDRIGSAIAPFEGAERRQQTLFTDGWVRVMDDYGHHPQEIRATLRALKETGCQRLLVAFQPHRYTRTRALLAQFAGSFAEADRLWLTEVYAASEDEIPGADGAALANAVRATGQTVEYVPVVNDIVGVVKRAMRSGDLVLFLGAGDITHAAQTLARELREERAAMNEAIFQQLTDALAPQSVARRDEPMARRTTLRVGGPADFYVEPASEADLRTVLAWAAKQQIPWRLLGRGSNLLVSDAGYRGLILNLAQPAFSQIEVAGDRLTCGAGAKLKEVALTAKRHGLGGLEFLEGIPGSVGGALRMNAGAMGASTFELVESVRFMEPGGAVLTLPAGGVEVHYRNCPLFRDHIALGAVFRGQSVPEEQIRLRMEECANKRWSSQPKQSSAGCMFKNPAAIPAGKLIDELKLKGLRIGGAVVSEVHGNFIVNDGHATARDVREMIELVRQRVREARGIELHVEVEMLGE